MLSRFASSLCSNGGKRFLRQSQPFQRRRMGGGGAFMETSKFGENVGEIFGTICWLWIFHRFRQDGAVVLGYEHPWDHGNHSDEEDHGASHNAKALTEEDVVATWEKFSDRSTIPGDDDDDDDEDDDDDDDE